MKKYISGFAVALIVVLSLFGTAGQAYAATGTKSLSKWVYAEYPELFNFYSLNGTYETYDSFWSKTDTFLTGAMTNETYYDYWHLFIRRDYFSGGAYVRGEDSHAFFRVMKTSAATPVRINGHVLFKNSSGAYVEYEYLVNNDWPIKPRWSSLTPPSQGFVTYQDATVGDITMFEKMDLTKPYDPLNPPAYAQPGLNVPDPGVDPSNPPNGADPDFPVQPTPPDSNWDLIGWVKYVVDWIIYLVKCFVYFLKSFGESIADVVNGSASLISAMTDFLAFLPNQITAIISMGIVAMIVVGVVKR